MRCPKCKKSIDKGTFIGSSVPPNEFCEDCGEKLEELARLCPSCHWHHELKGYCPKTGQKLSEAYEIEKLSKLRKEAKKKYAPLGYWAILLRIAFIVIPLVFGSFFSLLTFLVNGSSWTKEYPLLSIIPFSLLIVMVIASGFSFFVFDFYYNILWTRKFIQKFPEEAKKLKYIPEEVPTK